MLNRLVRRGLRRGLAGGDVRWLVVGAAAWLVRAALRGAGREPETVETIELAPGETLIIRHTRTTWGELGRGS